MSTAPEGDTTQRYLVGVPIAVVALLPLLVRRPRMMTIVSVVAAIYCVSGPASLATFNTSQSASLRHVASVVEAIAHREHISYGYSDYWEATLITLDSNFEVQVYPVMTCHRDYANSQPAHSRPSMAFNPTREAFCLRTGARPSCAAAPQHLDRVPRNPRAAGSTFHIGSSYKLLIYGYDIATRIHPGTTAAYARLAGFDLGAEPGRDLRHESPRHGRLTSGPARAARCDPSTPDRALAATRHPHSE